ncbi:hypothetical protein GCM10029964_087500 [Kibdelosporangium lantanae]
MAAVATIVLTSACDTQATGDTKPASGSDGSTESAGTGMVAYSKCMRTEGVRDFPDPNAQGKIDLGSGKKFDPNSDVFKAADTKCKKLLPDGGNAAPPPAAVGPAQINYAKCMRENGVPKFPDPNAEGGIDLNGETLGVDPTGPVFKAADDKCKHFLEEAAGGAPRVEKTGGP